MTTAAAVATQELPQFISHVGNTVTFKLDGQTCNRVANSEGVFTKTDSIYQVKDGAIIFLGYEKNGGRRGRPPAKKATPASSVLATVVPAQAPQPLQSEFPINQRFEFMEKFVQMVLDKELVSTIITGDGGLGKSFTVLEELKKRGLVEDEDYVVIKGYATPKALYATLYEWNGKIVIFDDCDSVLKDPTATSILKSALDSYEVRRISWLTKGFIDDGLPLSFEFTGQVIFVSNMSIYKMDQAVRSRTLLIDLSMSTEDKIERMRFILPSILPNIPLRVRQLALEFLISYAEEAKEFNIRTLLKVIKIVNSYGPDNTLWADAVKYVLTNS